MDHESYMARLDQIASNCPYTGLCQQKMIEYQVKILERFLRPGRTLEVGPADGIATQRLLEMGLQVTVVEASRHFAEVLQAKFPHMEIVHTLCENFEPRERYHNIVMGHVLEHVLEPKVVLKRAQS